MSRNRGQVFESLAVGSLEQLFFVSIAKLSGRCFCSLRPPCLCPSKGHKHGVAIQSSVNLGDTLLRITRNNMQYNLPEDYKNFFLLNCKSQIYSKGTFEETLVKSQLMMASCGPLHGKESVWADLTSIRFEGSYKLASLDRDELNSLRSVYVTMYPKVTEASFALATIYKKYKSLSVGDERYGSTAGSRLCPYARIIASWCGDNGVVNLGSMRPGIVRYFMVHSVEIKGKQSIHAFAVVNWFKSSEQDLGFGNPLSVWLPDNTELGGPAVFLPVQRIHSKFLFVDKLYSGQRYLICSPICRRILL